jgi:NAD(P)-dependent dehydrogenase (short-subunit alcohol dehydrogenase family)
MEEIKKFVLITGASSGIGRCIAINLSDNYNLILHGRDEERLLETKALCNKDGDHLLFQMDLSKVDEIESSFSDFIRNQKIEVSHFVHCAGNMKMIPLKMVSLQFINTTFATNTISAVLLVKVLMQRKINSSALTSVVLLSSNISNFGAKAFSIYAASKAALDAIMRCLAIELAPNVRINSVLPGAIETEMTKSIFENKEVVDRMEKEYPLGIGEAKDIFHMVDFLLSDNSKWITGQQFVVDGGRTINISG